MTRSIGLTDAAETTVYRAVGEYLVNGEPRRVYTGLYNTPGPARQRVTWWRNHPASRPSGEDRPMPGVSWALVDAWIEPVTVTNHPGVRYTNDWPAPDNRMAAIESIADALGDSLCGDEWRLSNAIRDIASGEKTPAQVHEDLGDEWKRGPT